MYLHLYLINKSGSKRSMEFIRLVIKSLNYARKECTRMLFCQKFISFLYLIFMKFRSFYETLNLRIKLISLIIEMRDVKNSRTFLALRLVERSRKPSRILRNPKFKGLFKRGISIHLHESLPSIAFPFIFARAFQRRDSSPKDDRSRVRLFAVPKSCAMLEIRKKETRN